MKYAFQKILALVN